MAANPAREMTAALKRLLVPSLTSAGFEGRFPRFCRRVGGTLQFLAVFFDKQNTAFFLEFGAHPCGEKLTSWGEVVPEEKLLLEHVLFNRRARLQANCEGGSMVDQWFCFAAYETEKEYNALAELVAGMLPQVEAWFASALVGPNLSANGF